MKKDILQAASETTQDFGTLDHQISPQSLERFLRDDRIWPVELWMKVRDPEGHERLTLVQLHPDPCGPEPGRNALEREWTQRSRDPEHSGYIRTIRECPERIIAGCRLERPMERLHATWWETDNGMPPGYLYGGGQKPEGDTENRPLSGAGGN